MSTPGCDSKHVPDSGQIAIASTPGLSAGIISPGDLRCQRGGFAEHACHKMHVEPAMVR
jgi:hypothetical protein